MKTIHWVLFLGLIFSVHARLAAQTPEPLRGDFDEALLRQWVQPDYPAAARQEKIEGEVVVEFVVEADGRVSRASVKNSTDERFNPNALAAVQSWVFVPATNEGKPAASGMQVRVAFKLAQLEQKKAPLQPPAELMPTALRIVPAKLLSSPAPEYPPELEESRLSGQVVLEFTVETDGSVVAPVVLWATHAAFVGEALKVLQKYRFEPASQGPLPLKSTTKGQIEFAHLGWNREELLSNHGITVTDGENFGKVPLASVLLEPVYPRERLLAGETGSAAVEFTVTERGAVEDVLLKEASEPEFGAALVAAVETWAFEPALFDKQAAAAKLVVAHKFALPLDGPLHRLMLAKQPDGAGVASASGLDERLRPLWRIPPLYPRALLTDKPSGRAMVQFIIDRGGRVRLPRIVSATHPEFGWAAATAISQWVFAPPLRAGQPVDTEVSIPVDFALPKE